MARMSIDDSVGRDPRVTILAKLMGWSRRETVGCLVCDVWPIAYDQRTHLLSERLIDAAADREGFAAAMVESGLAKRDRSGKLRITGAKKRIKYLEDKSESGRLGGLKSAEVRAEKSKQTSSKMGSTPQAPRNPPVPDPDPVSAPVPVDPISDAPSVRGARARDPREPSTGGSTSTERWLALPSWEGGVYAPAQRPRDLGLLAEAFWFALERVRGVIGAELGIAVIPLPQGKLHTFGSEPKGFRDLRDRIRAEGPIAPIVCTHVLENLVADARDTGSLEWLSEKVFGEGSWMRARDRQGHGAGRAPPKASGAIGAAAARSDHAASDEPVPFSDDVRSSNA